MKKCRCLIFILIAIIFSGFFDVAAAIDYQIDVPYQTYIYNSDNKPVSIPSAFTVERVITGREITGTDFKSLNDIFYNGTGAVFICDSGNNRIILTDSSFNVTDEISQFTYNNKTTALLNPQGVWADDKLLYVADTGNQRIVVFDISQRPIIAKSIFTKPVIFALGNDYEYSPVRLTVDTTQKIYVIASGINQGVICLDENGAFQSFLGAPKVEPNFLEMLWRKIATKEQLSRMESYVPTEYSSITMNQYGFLYVTSATSNSVPVGKINSDGDNILAKPQQGWYGDDPYLTQNGEIYTPYFNDVALYRSGKIDEDVYYIADSKQGKIYAYTEDGYLLYIFGGTGNQQGTYFSANALEYIYDSIEKTGRLLVTDAIKGTLTILKETEFAVDIRNAMQMYNSGDYDGAKNNWTKVQLSASGYILADIGLAKIELQNKQYHEAMTRLKNIRAYNLYSDAFEAWRDQVIRDNFLWILFILILSTIIIVVTVKLFKRSNLYIKIGSSKTYQGYRYGSHVIFHPFDGFWDLKYEKRGNIRSAFLIGILFFILYAVRLQFTGYIVSKKVSDETNVLFGVTMLLLPILFYIISNWCFTTLMDGKGNMKDIVIATCYAFKPYVIFSVPMLIVSNILTISELPFYNFFDVIIWVWTISLLIISLMITHDYSLSKTILTVVLVIIGICLIVFIILLMISIAQNIYSFIYNLYQELTFRSY